jgi:hypothetical protein
LNISKWQPPESAKLFIMRRFVRHQTMQYKILGQKAHQSTKRLPLCARADASIHALRLIAVGRVENRALSDEVVK